MINPLLKKIIPKGIKEFIKANQQKKLKDYVNSLPLLSENDFKDILINHLNLKLSDTVFIHSSIDRLNLDFPFYKIINLLFDVIGSDGTIAFPTYPPTNSYDYLKTNPIFNIKKTPSYTGLLSEFARRHPDAKRSLHPSKSIVAIGKNADILTSNHNISHFPYDFNSPYYKLVDLNAKVIGIGVRTTYLSMVHTIDDTLRDVFPINPYHKELFNIKCVDHNKSEIIVSTYAHDMKKMRFDLPKFFAKYFDNDICKDINLNGMNFFRADASKLYFELKKLFEINNITIYSKL